MSFTVDWTPQPSQIADDLATVKTMVREACGLDAYPDDAWVVHAANVMELQGFTDELTMELVAAREDILARWRKTIETRGFG